MSQKGSKPWEVETFFLGSFFETFRHTTGALWHFLIFFWNFFLVLLRVFIIYGHGGVKSFWAIWKSHWPPREQYSIETMDHSCKDRYYSDSDVRGRVEACLHTRLLLAIFGKSTFGDIFLVPIGISRGYHFVFFRKNMPYFQTILKLKKIRFAL